MNHHPIFNQAYLMLCYGGIILSVFVVLLLNARDVKKGRANLFLSILLLALAFSIAHILFAGAVISHLSTQFYSVGDPTFFLIAPLLWFYTRALAGEKAFDTWKVALHFLPFLLMVFLSVSLRGVRDPTITSQLNNIQGSVIIGFWLLLILQFSWYLLTIRNNWHEYKQLVREEISNTEHVSIGWVRYYMLVFLAVNVIFLISLLVALHLEDRSWLSRITAIVFALSIFALGYKGILQREVFAVAIAPSINEAKRTPLTRASADSDRLVELKAFMTSHKPYLDPELTLTSLAAHMNMTRGQLSVLINDGTGSNFYDFVNEYRVEQVKRLMVDPAMDNLSMLGIALEAGFKSKSTFNLIFKRFTGLTPTDYKRKLTNHGTS